MNPVSVHAIMRLTVLHSKSCQCPCYHEILQYYTVNPVSVPDTMRFYSITQWILPGPLIPWEFTVLHSDYFQCPWYHEILQYYTVNPVRDLANMRFSSVTQWILSGTLLPLDLQYFTVNPVRDLANMRFYSIAQCIPLESLFYTIHITHNFSLSL